MTVWHSVICEERKKSSAYGWIAGLPPALRDRVIAGFLEGKPHAVFEVTREELRALTGREPA